MVTDTGPGVHAADCSWRRGGSCSCWARFDTDRAVTLTQLADDLEAVAVAVRVLDPAGTP